MTTQFFEIYNKIKAEHKEVLKLLESAVQSEENENVPEALEIYKKSIVLIDEALATPVRLPENVESVKKEWYEACRMIHQLKKARAEVLQRVAIINKENEMAGNKQEDWTLVSLTETDSGSGRLRTYTELGQALRNMQYTSCSLNSLELLFSCDGVKLYHIKPNGIVTSTMEDSVMRIIRMEKDEEKGLKATFFIQIIKSSKTVPIKHLEQFGTNENDENQYNAIQEQSSNDLATNSQILDNFDGQNGSSWIYPLIPGASPCFRTHYGAFIFPDLESSELGTSFGVIVPKDENRNDEIVLEILEAILHGVVIQTTEEDKEKASSEQISENIVRGAQYISQNLIKGAQKTGKFISYATPYLISKIKGAPSDAPPVSENIQTTVDVAKNVTGVAAGATGYIAGKIGSATMALGRFLAPHIEKHGSTLLSKGLGMNEEEAHRKMSDVLTVAAGAVEGFGTIYCGLEESAKILGTNLGENSVKIIEHKYGPSAGNLASGTFDTVGNMINLSQNVSYFTPKGFTKKTAKNAGKAIIQTYQERHHNRAGTTISASSLYPDLTLLEAEVKK